MKVNLNDDNYRKVVLIEKLENNCYCFVTKAGFIYKVDDGLKKILWRLKTLRGRNFTANPINIIEKNGLLFMAEHTQIGSDLSDIISSMKIDERGILLREETVLDEPFVGAGLGSMELLDNGKLLIGCSFLNTFGEYSTEERLFFVTKSFSGDGDYDAATKEFKTKFKSAADKLNWLSKMGFDLS